MLAFFAMVALGSPVFAGEARPAWHGVWQGTIGTLPVMACFQSRDSGYANGSYYYLARKRPIALSQEGERWLEGDSQDATGAWQLAARDAGLAGTWTRGSRKLPIALKPVAWLDDDDRPCGSAAYTAPRVVSLGATAKPARQGAIDYTALAWTVGPNFDDVGIASFAVPETRPGDAATNAALRLDPAEAEGAADWLGCMRRSLAGLGLDGDFHIELKPVVVNTGFVVAARHQAGSCGGAHPYFSHDWLVFDRDSGKKVDLVTWLTAEGIARRLETNLAEPTRRLRAHALGKMALEEGECRSAVAETEFWVLGLSGKGLVLSPSLPHVVQACAEDAEIPFAELVPYLSAEGRKALVRMR